MKIRKIILNAVVLSAVFTPQLFGQKAHAENLELLRRWVVFPYDADASLKEAADNAWWKFREKLTADRKYLVASRQFLVQKDAFQPRKELSPDDVKLLARLLEADVVVTGFSEHRQFTLNAYLAQNGQLFWTKHMSFHPSLRPSDQLELISDKLGQELLAQIPYQAFTVTDPLIGKTVYEEGGHKYAIIDVGNSDSVGVGSEVQWVDIVLPVKPASGALADQTKIAVIGEGKVTKVRPGIAVVELQKAKSVDSISEKTLVRFPSEVAKTPQAYNNDTVHERLAPEMIPTIINPVEPDSTGVKRRTLVFGSIIGVLGIIAVAL